MRSISGDFLAIDRKARAKMASQGIQTRPVDERMRDFDDVVIPLDPESAMLEAARCVQCPDPAPCMLACPTHNDIPSAMWLIEQGQFLEAAQLYRPSSSFPEICGRVCPQYQLCQGSCSQNKSSVPVMTGALEAFVVDYSRRLQGVNIPVGQSLGKRVAIVGAGPGGLSAAYYLALEGYGVTIFEKLRVAGGMLAVGIPSYRLPRDILRAEVDNLRRRLPRRICHGGKLRLPLVHSAARTPGSLRRDASALIDFAS